MKPQLVLLALCLLGLASCAPAHAQSEPASAGPATAEAPRTAQSVFPPGYDPARYMRVAEVKEGMTGYGLSVFKGTAIERFDVRVLSVLKNFNPKYDVILIECKGANLEHTGPIAGMSGSPIFLTDDQGRSRLAGAFAYGWPMMKDPIAGVQPVEYMLNIPVTPAAEQDLTGARASADAANAPASQIHTSWNLREVHLPGLRGQSTASFFATAPRTETEADDAQRMRPLATPLMTSGMSPAALRQIAPLFAASGLVPLQAGGSTTQPSTGPARFEPGSVLAVPLLIGDVDMTAVGTCTDVIGDRVLGFGHSFNNEGPTNLPMGTGEIDAIIANLNTSFKLGSMTKLLGSLLADQTTGVAGQTGTVAPMVPITLRIVYADGSEDQTYHFRGALHPKLTTQIAGAALAAAVSGDRELPQYHTLNYDITLSFFNGKSIRIQNTAVNADANELFGEIGLPIGAAAENPFTRVLLKEMTGTIRVIPEAREAEILSVSVPKLKYRPGETAKVFVTYHPFHGSDSILPIEFEIPRELNDGVYHFVVTDWKQYLQDEIAAKPFRFTAETGDEVFAVLTDVMGIRHDALYLQLLREPDGIALGRTAMPHLPSSRRQVLLEAGLSTTTQFISSTTKIVPTDVVMDGSAEFDITIDKEARVEGAAARQPPKHEPHAPAANPAPKPDEPKGKTAASQPSN